MAIFSAFNEICFFFLCVCLFFLHRVKASSTIVPGVLPNIESLSR